MESCVCHFLCLCVSCPVPGFKSGSLRSKAVSVVTKALIEIITCGWFASFLRILYVLVRRRSCRLISLVKVLFYWFNFRLPPLLVCSFWLFGFLAFWLFGFWLSLYGLLGIDGYVTKIWLSSVCVSLDPWTWGLLVLLLSCVRFVLS
ncbi:hypothetical protein B0T09DRAFT_183195 [Sordaria sp. MPI-SDFR-AT-0083]|nr:hypothetical protein B0T09DRAFT_183195 [Sordaria sp. MPI-SDFR-AT-0083]